MHRCKVLTHHCGVPPDKQLQPARTRTTLSSLLVVVALAIGTSPGFAQAPGPKPRVHLGSVRVDSFLLAFDADSGRIRLAVLDALRQAGRLALESGAGVPVLDIDAGALRLSYGGMLEPRGFVRVEVGRNLMEAGKAQALQWSGAQDLPPSPTFRDLGRSVLPTVLKVVHDYILGRRGGA